MTLTGYEIGRGRTALMIWTAAIGFLMLVSVLLFPEMSKQAEMIDEVYSSMGAMTEAFGMDRVNMSDALGFYGIECGNVLGIGGAFFAALLGILALAGEEKNRTAEFLLTHPISRTRIVTEKLISLMLQVCILNIVTMVIGIASFLAIGEDIAWKEFFLLHAAYLLMMLEIACICFGISAFLRRAGAGVGIGIAAMLYFMNIIANISEKAEFLKYITPFGYTETADIIVDGHIHGGMLFLGFIYSTVMVAMAYVKYRQKDIY